MMPMRHGFLRPHARQRAGNFAPQPRGLTSPNSHLSSKLGPGSSEYHSPTLTRSTMSGIEVAGLVLGALPLIVEVLKAYSNGASTIRRYIRFQRPLKSLSTELSIEHVLYQRSCERLLDGLVDDNNEREALLKKPGGPAWKNPELETKLQQRLSKGCSVFVDAINEVEFAVTEIMKLLKFSPDGPVR